MKVYKATIMVLDIENIGSENITSLFDRMDFFGGLVSLEHHEIGAWDDSHPLNKQDTWKKEFNRLFEDEKIKELEAQRDALAQVIDPGNSDSALISRIIMKSIENQLFAEDAIEECIAIIEEERLTDDTNTPEDRAYNLAIDHVINTLRSRKNDRLA